MAQELLKETIRTIEVNGVSIQVEKKNIKNMYIRVLSPEGLVKMTVPKKLSDDTIRSFALSKIDWIKKNKEKFEKRPKIVKKQYISGEYFYLWGERYRLEVVYSKMKNPVSVEGDKIILQAYKDSTLEQREHILEEWYRKQLKNAIPASLARCENIVGKSPNEWRIKNMKTKWGTCNISKKRIWLNLQLVKKSSECLDYVITHELVHLYVRNHNAEFKAYMDKFYPNWKAVKKKLNEHISD